MDRTRVRARIREMIRTGELPCDLPRMAWVGKGQMALCASCAVAITPADTEIEVELPATRRKVVMHNHCHSIWLEECELHKHAG